MRHGVLCHLIGDQQEITIKNEKLALRQPKLLPRLKLKGGRTISVQGVMFRQKDGIQSLIISVCVSKTGPTKNARRHADCRFRAGGLSHFGIYESLYGHCTFALKIH